MNDEKKLERKEFLKLALLSSAGLYLEACGVPHRNPPPIPEPVKDTVHTDSLSIPEKQKAIKLPEHLYKKGDVQYDELRKGFNKRIDKYPAAIALCASAEEVAIAVAYGINQQLPISIKSGGHSFEGFSCNNDGLVIDLSPLHQIEWENSDTIIIGPACKLSELNEALLPKHKLLPAGSCGGVGIGGLTLGGGYGLFSRKFGLTCDSLLEITLVDGRGNIINSKEDPELLWACKGGGNGNFGVVTSMKFKVQEAPAFLQSYRFRISRVAVPRALEVLKQWFSITANLPLTCFSAFVLNGKSLYILLTDFGDSDENIQPILSSLTSLVDRTEKGNKIPLSKAVKTFYGEKNPLYFKNASAGMYRGFEDIAGCIEKVMNKVTTTADMIYQVNTLGGKINDAIFETNSAYSHRSQHYLSELQTYWRSPSQTDRMVRAFEEVQNLFGRCGPKEQYRNYPDVNLKDWESAYYGNSYNRLQKVKATYDPQNIFRYEQSIKA